jgi:ankyrin repeat protein
VASYLEEHGADVNMKNNVSTTACGLAVMAEMVIVNSEG